MRFSTKLMLAMLLATTAIGVALAQNGNPSPSPSPTPEPQASPASPSQNGPSKFYLEVSPEDIQAISTALNELPKRVADPLILKLNGQLQKQSEIKAAAEAATKPAEKKANRK